MKTFNETINETCQKIEDFYVDMYFTSAYIDKDYIIVLTIQLFIKELEDDRFYLKDSRELSYSYKNNDHTLKHFAESEINNLLNIIDKTISNCKLNVEGTNKFVYKSN